MIGVAACVSVALLGAVVTVALVARDVAFRAIDGQMAYARERDDRDVDVRLAAMADRVAAVESVARDMSIRGVVR